MAASLLILPAVASAVIVTQQRRPAQCLHLCNMKGAVCTADQMKQAREWKADCLISIGIQSTGPNEPIGQEWADYKRRKREAKEQKRTKNPTLQNPPK